MAEARDGPARSFMPKLSRGGGGPSEFGRWLRNNGSTLFILTLLFLLALFIRSYFAYEMSADNGYLVSGGSDSYYWQRIIDYHVETGLNLFWDPMLNYPDGLVNPRPPLFSMSIAIPAVLAESLFSSAEDATGFFFVWSTAFWGALTVIPVYFLGRETFGRRAGLVAALLFAIIPAHVQRSVLSNADHDSLILFLIVAIFFFLLKAVKVQEHRKWVEDWKSRTSIVAGLRNYLANSRTAMLYALLAGTVYAALMMTWVGFAYVTVIILLYYIVQLLVNTFRYQDSTSVTLLLLMSMGFGYLLAFPYYANYSAAFGGIDSFFNDRFLIPVLLTAGGLLFGIMFVVTRDLPWTISLPSIALISVAIIGVISLFYPWLGEAIMTGQGYFSQSKLYTTIAEARAPQFSELALSFGMVTFFLALAGLIYALVRIPKRTGAEYIFIVVWLAASIFMAISAGRFMFNAAPAFAIAAAWVVVSIVDTLDFNGVRRSMTGASGSPLTVFRKSVKIRHVLGVLFLAFLVILPNVWFSVDAGIPSETKRSYDKDIYFSLPSVMRPSGYDETNGSNWYLGAFGYSLPLPSYYYPAAWQWFSEQDSDVYPASSRPAYVAWWDYGFEAVAEGDHPTVADNFQNGYQFTGNVIMAQSEEDTIALFAFRLAQTGMAQSDVMKARILSVLDRHGVDSARFEEILSGPAAPIVAEVLSDPDVYGPMSSDLSGANARIVAGRVELAKIGVDNLVAMYGEVCGLTGWEIRYFNVDSRMFPISGYETGIFYAPAKLADRRLDGSIPVDFFKIVAVDDRGIEYEFDELTAAMTITDYKIVYTDMFYDSMFYRAMCGLSGTDLGLSNDGLPGYSGVIQGTQPMPGWNMSHFRMVYRTAYYNPYPSDQLAYHSKDWTAVSFEEAVELKKKISAGEITGVVDDSAGSLYRSGTVFLKYYHGAYVNGTVTTAEGYPAVGLLVTVLDDYGIPHGLTETDSDGKYSVLAPFGNVTVVISDGMITNANNYASNVVTRIQFDVTDDQAMRVKQDLDGDGTLDYIITKDYVVKDSQISGDIFWDVDMEGNYTAETDELITGVTVYAVDTTSDRTFVFDAPDGTYAGLVPPGQYDVFAIVEGSNMTIAEATDVAAGRTVSLDLPVEPAKLRGYLLYPDGAQVRGSTIALKDVFSGAEFPTVTTEEGAYVYERLPPSKYSMTTYEPDKTIFNERFSLDSFAQQRNITLWDKCTVSFRITINAVPAAYANWVITDDYDPKSAVSGSADKYGMVRMDLPPGQYSLQAVYNTASGKYTGYASLDLSQSSHLSGTVPLYEAYTITGGLKGAQGQVLRGGETITFMASSGARLVARSDSLGSYDALLQKGVYTVIMSSTVGGGVYGGTYTVEGDAVGVVFQLSEGISVSGTLYEDADGDGEPSQDERAPFTGIDVTDSDGYVYKSKSRQAGSFTLMFPKGERVTVTVADPAYSLFSQSLLYGADLTDTAIVAVADPVGVKGQVTHDGWGVSGIVITFTPEDTRIPPVVVISGADGRYSVLLETSYYTVDVDQESTYAPGHWYQHHSELKVVPSQTYVTRDISLALRVPVSGVVLGAAQDLRLVFSGPEEVSLNLTTLSYSLFLEPGTYSVYGTGRTGEVPYASMDSVAVRAFAGDYDFQLERAYKVSGVIRVGDSVTTRPVTVTATSLEGIQAVNVSTRFGQYSLTLPPGVYALSFMLEDAEPMGDTTAFVERWYETVIPLGSENYALNPSLMTRLDNTTVAGKVVDESGNPITAQIEFIPNGKYGMYSSFMTTSSGSYTAQLQPGEYTVYVTRSVDRCVSVSYLAVVRNVASTYDVQLSLGKYLQGRLTVASAPASEDVTVTAGDIRLTTVSSADGYFQLVLPDGSYTVTSTTTRVEGGLTVSYSLTRSVALVNSSVYLDFELLRDTRRTVRATWNSDLAVTAAPGQTVSYVVKIENTGNIADTYTLSYGGTDFELSFEPEGVSIDFGSNGNTAYAVVRITVGETAESGNNTVPVTVKSDSLSSARTDVRLMVKVSVSRSVSIESMNTTAAVSSTVTTTRFLLSNTGNAEDNFAVSVANAQSLNVSGWSASIVDPETEKEVVNVTLAAFGSKELMVEFTSLRAVTDPRAEAVVLASSLVDGLANSYGSVPVMLPDLSIGPGDMDVVRDDVSAEYDVGRIYIDIALAVVLVSMVLIFFIMRKRKGLSGGGKK